VSTCVVVTVCRAVFSVRVATWHIATNIYEFPAVLREKYVLFSFKCLEIETSDCCDSPDSDWNLSGLDPVR